MQYKRLFLLLLLLIPLACLGTSIIRISLEETVNKAEWIVEGDVVRNWCGWDSGHRFIWTHTEIAVRDQWKGSVGPTVTVSEPGGVADGMKMDIAGMVRYAPGEHVVVFLFRTPSGLIRTVGLAQGKLEIDNRGLVHPALAGGMLVSPIGAKPRGTSVDELESSSLSAAHDRIVRMAGGAKAVGK
jgi:hypothetical protein